MKEQSRTLVELSPEKNRFRAGTFPQKYVQGCGLLKNIYSWTAAYGERALLIGGSRALSVVQETIKTNLSENGVNVSVVLFGGESTEEEIQRLYTLAQYNNADYLIAAGGGKVIDTVKAVSSRLKRPVVVVPTVASTDAPTSTISVIYDGEGNFSNYIKLPFNPEVVLMDSSVIVQAPFRYLAAGIGGAMGIYYEAPLADRSRAVSTAGGRALKSAILLAEGIKNILLKDAAAAKLSVERGVVTESLESVIEAVILMSGIGFESGGLAAAHGVYHGYRYLNKENPKMHGELVAFGTIVQMILMNHPQEEIDEVLSLFCSIGLPMTFEEIGISSEEVLPIAKIACEEGTVKNMGFTIPNHEFAGAMHIADSLGREKMSSMD